MSDRFGDSSTDPLTVLGLGPDATESEVRAEYRRRAKRVHPDTGGGHAHMAELNATLERALSALAARSAHMTATGGAAPAPVSSPRAAGYAVSPSDDAVYTMVDHPSFTIEALPAVAFEALMACSAEMAVVTEEPPYLLEVEIDEPLRCSCRLELFPDAGSTTVALSVRTRVRTIDIDEIRDRWITRLNTLDWSSLEVPPP